MLEKQDRDGRTIEAYDLEINFQLTNKKIRNNFCFFVLLDKVCKNVNNQNLLLKKGTKKQLNISPNKT